MFLEILLWEMGPEVRPLLGGLSLSFIGGFTIKDTWNWPFCPPLRGRFFSMKSAILIGVSDYFL